MEPVHKNPVGLKPAVKASVRRLARAAARFGDNTELVHCLCVAVDQSYERNGLIWLRKAMAAANKTPWKGNVASLFKKATRLRISTAARSPGPEQLTRVARRCGDTSGVTSP